MLRNPHAAGWKPTDRDGEPTASEEVAREWVTDYLRAFRAKGLAGQLGTRDAPRLTLVERMADYLRDREQVDRVKRGTWYNDQGAIRLLIEWFGKDTVPETITADALQKKMNARLRAGAATSTCRTTKAHLSHFFDWLGMTGHNPARLLAIKGQRSQKKYGWSNEQITRLRDAADAIDRAGEYRISARYAFELALGTGVREGELFGLEGVHLNERARTCKVVQQSSRMATRMVETKGGDAGVALVLPEYWPHHRPGVNGLLLTFDGTPIRQARERYIIDAVIRQAELKRPGERSHMTRHTYARLFLEEYGGDLRDLQKFLRHKSLKTTEQYYGHYSTDVAVERAGARIYGTEKPRLRVV